VLLSLRQLLLLRDTSTLSAKPTRKRSGSSSSSMCAVSTHI
jgi:hypothetical protein